MKQGGALYVFGDHSGEIAVLYAVGVATVGVNMHIDV